MRYLSPLLTLALVAALTAAQTDSKPATNPQAATHLFDYDAKQPLDIHDKVIDQFKGGTLHDITYTSPKGGPVGAYLVVPNGNGPFAAVLFGHWGNGTRAEFIPEAKIYARAGAISLIPDYPWDRPQPWHKTPDHFDKLTWTAKSKFRPWPTFAGEIDLRQKVEDSFEIRSGLTNGLSFVHILNTKKVTEVGPRRRRMHRIGMNNNRPAPRRDLF
jgi:hypothetical protein